MIVSALNGWSVILLAGLCAIAALFLGSWYGFIVGAAITASGAMEVIGRQKLKGGSIAAGKWLCGSQIWLFVVIVCYVTFELWTFDSTRALNRLPTELVETYRLMLGIDAATFTRMMGTIFRTIYVAVLIISFFYQGGLWFFYRKFCLSAQKVEEKASEGGNLLVKNPPLPPPRRG